MRFLWRWLKRSVLALVGLVVLLLLPVGYVELACQGEARTSTYDPIIRDPDWQRAESRTLMTYPEWHIVHAYDDYAKVIATGDPHDFAYLSTVAGFWTALCPLTKASAEMGGVTTETKMTIYTIGVSFTAELLLKAGYEETLGRIATVARGKTRSPLDDLSARQAADYARFLQQTPWYKWDFAGDKAALAAAAGEAFRDRERWFALGIEYGGKAAYANVIAEAVEGVGADQLRIRSVVAGLSVEALAAMPDVEVIEAQDRGVLIETPRYRAFTSILAEIAGAGGELVEIAGNDEILFTLISEARQMEGALHTFPRQGYGDYRHLVLASVTELAAQLQVAGDGLEHVHDY